MLPSARLFLCPRCHTQCLICRQCDRGHVYCSDTCAINARTDKQREANQRYSHQRSARVHAAARQAARRARIASQSAAEVTDQGSDARPPERLSEHTSTTSTNAVRTSATGCDGELRCHRCTRICDPFVRSLSHAVRTRSTPSTTTLAPHTRSMTIDAELEAKILRYHHVEGWGVNTIAAQLGVHHSSVDRVLSQAGMPKLERATRPSMIDPFLPFITQTLTDYPTLSAARLFHMARARGYIGCESHFRARISGLRPRRVPEAYLRLRTLPGEQAQVDWGHFGHLSVGRAKRPLMAFVMVLSYSRQVFLRFTLDARAPSFAAGHVAAFERFGGSARVLLYDNLKSAVLERDGRAIRFNPQLLELAAHYHFELRPVAVARGNEKGRVERAIRYIRDSFFAGITFTDLDDLNGQAQRWCDGIAADRPCPEERSITVREAFEQEREHLIALPTDRWPCEERCEARVGKTPYVRFDKNDYSVPHTHVQRTLSVLASLHTVRVLDGAEQIAQHRRSFDQGMQIETAAHLDALKAEKRAASEHRGKDRLHHAAPSSTALLQGAVARGGQSIRTLVRQLTVMLEQYGGAELEHACAEALAREVPHPNAVRVALERRREERQLPPPVPVYLPDDARTRDIVVRTGSLSGYDRLVDTDSYDGDHDNNSDINEHKGDTGNDGTP